MMVSLEHTPQWKADVLLLRPYAGPVRGVAIHPTRPLLVTGGDDYKIKVWGEVSYLHGWHLPLFQEEK